MDRKVRANSPETHRETTKGDHNINFKMGRFQVHKRKQ